MAKQFFTDDELVERLWDYENVKQLMAKHFYCYAGDLRRQELNDLWVKLPQNRRFASLGVNTGFYTGMEEVRFVPKRAMSPAECESLRALLRKKMGDRYLELKG